MANSQEDIEREVPRHKRGLLRNTSIVLLGTVVAQGISLLAIPFLARIYSPYAFGLWAIFQTALTFFAIAATLRFELVIITAKTEAESVNACALVCCASVIVSFVVTVAVFLWGNSLASAFGIGKQGWILWLFPPEALVQGLTPAAVYWWFRHHDYMSNSTYRIVLNSVTVAIQAAVGLWLIEKNDYGLAVGTIVGQFVVGGAAFSYLLATQWSSYPEMWSFSRIWQLAKANKGYPLYSGPAVIIEQLYAQMMPILLTYWFSASVTGHFFLALRICGNPFFLISGAISQAFLPTMARAASDLSRLGPLISRVCTYLVLLGMPIVVELALHAGTIFLTLFGTRWTGIADYVVPLVMTYPLLAAVSWISRIYDVAQRQSLNLLLAIAMNILAVGGSLAGKWWAGDPSAVLFGFGAGLVVGHILWVMAAMHVGGIKQAALLRPAAAIVLSGGAILAVDLAMSSLFHDWWLALSLAPFAAVYYAAIGVRIFQYRRRVA